MNPLIAATGGTRTWLVGLSILVAGAIAAAAAPSRHPFAGTGADIDLERVVPTRFGNWQLASSEHTEAIRPELQAQIDATYVRTLGRSYVNSRGERVMLSIAYGSNQLIDSTQSHRPEYCYKAQGFKLVTGNDDTLAAAGATLPLRRLVASRPGREEPISYWMTIANRALLPGIDRKLAQLRHGIAGEIPDGLLVRVSSIDPDSRAAYQVHDRFIRDLLASVDNPGRFGLARVAPEIR